MRNTQNEDQHREDSDNQLQSYEASLLEKVLDQNYGPDVTAKVAREVVETGDLNSESLSKLGVTDDMLEETVAHYRTAAQAMLQPVGSCTSYLENMLTEGEAQKVRAAIVSRDMAEVQRLGVIARDRAASMDFKQINEFLSRDERLKLRVRQQGTLVMVDLPGVGTTSWANAVISGRISFR